MFGLGRKDQGPKLVGAKEKRMKAQMLKRGRLSDHIESKGEGKQPRAATVVLIYIISCALSYILMAGPMKNQGLNWSTGWRSFDRVMFGAGVPSITGVEIQDQILTVLLRGVVICLAGGLMPFLTLLWIRSIDRPNANPYFSFWGVSIGSIFVFFFVRDFFGPLLGQVMEIASPG